jgi:hypothetical protein
MFQISSLWQNYILKDHCSAGFAKAGIYPDDPRAVFKEKLLGPSSSIKLNNEIDIIDELTVLEDSFYCADSIIIIESILKYRCVL